MDKQKLIELLKASKHKNVIIDITSDTGVTYNCNFFAGNDDEHVNLQVDLSKEQTKDLTNK